MILTVGLQKNAFHLSFNLLIQWYYSIDATCAVEAECEGAQYKRHSWASKDDDSSL